MPTFAGPKPATVDGPHAAGWEGSHHSVVHELIRADTEMNDRLAAAERINGSYQAVHDFTPLLPAEEIQWAVLSISRKHRTEPESRHREHSGHSYLPQQSNHRTQGPAGEGLTARQHQRDKLISREKSAGRRYSPLPTQKEDTGALPR